MIVRDEAAITRLVKQKLLEASQQDYQNWLDNYSRLANFHDDPEIRPTDAARQMGTPMTHEVLEQKLGRLNRNLRFTWGAHSLQKKHKVMELVTPTGIEKLFVYPIGAIPERTIWRQKVEYVDSPDYKPSSQDHAESDWYWGPVEGHEDKYRPEAHKLGGWNDPAMLAANPDMPYWGEWKRKSEHAGRAGWRRLNHAWGKELRGWREILLMLVQKGLLTPAQVEREFHSDPSNPLWKQGLGKGFTTANVV